MGTDVFRGARMSLHRGGPEGRQPLWRTRLPGESLCLPSVLVLGNVLFVSLLFPGHWNQIWPFVSNNSS